MAEENKTKPTVSSVAAFLGAVEDPQRRSECEILLALMTRATGHRPVMWGDAIIGFGRQAYTYTSGRKGEWFLAGFSPRKQNLTLYLGWGFEGLEEQLARLGKFKKSVGCLYLKRLADVDVVVLEEMVARAVKRPAPAGITVVNLE